MGSMGVVDYLASGDKSFAKERVESLSAAGASQYWNDYRALELVP